MIQHLLFDLDGTLIDTWRLYMEAYRRTFEAWFQRPFQETDTLQLLGLRPRSETWLLKQMLGEGEHGDAFALFLDHYRRLHETLFDGPYTGVPAMLQALRQGGYRLGIVTGKSREAWRVTEPKAALVPFDVVITESEVAQPKPDPEGILAATAALRARPDTAVYIGDSLLDGEAATAAGLPFWAATWAKSQDERDAFIAGARARGATQILTTPTDVLAALPRPDRTAPRT